MTSSAAPRPGSSSGDTASAPVWKPLLEGRDLDREGSRALFDDLVAGRLDPVQLAAALIALKLRGETVEQIAGAAEALRAAAKPFPPVPDDAIDVCGTGGDGFPTVNVSTLVAFVGAEGGVPQVKHGNRAVSSNCGSADVLERFGVELEPTPESARAALERSGFCYLHAPAYHPGLRHAMPVRRALGVRTVLNLLGPLVNPGRPPLQLTGLYDPRWGEPVVRTLAALGVRRAWTVHGSGMDEFALHGPTTVHAWEDGAHRSFEVVPEDAGLPTTDLQALRTSTKDERLERFEAMLDGRGRLEDEHLVALNAAAMFVIADRAAGLEAGAALALDILRSGALRARVALAAEASRG